MKNLKEIQRIAAAHKEELQRKYKVRELGIFGSFVRGEQKRTSDVDILVEFEEDAKVSLLEFVNMENYLGDLLGMKVDLVEKPALKPRIGKNILKGVIYL